MKKLLLKLTLFIIPILIYIGVGIYIDAYNVFHVDHIRLTYVTPNQNFIKTKYILENKDKFNAFVFGSSRAANLPPDGLPKTTDDGTPLNWYNMTYAMGGIEENYMTVKTLTDTGVHMDEILILIDEISMWKGASDSLDNLIFTTYQTYEKNPEAFYYSYIKQKPLLKLLPEIHSIHVSERTGDREYIQREELFYSYGVDRLDTELNITEGKEMPPAEHSLEYNDECQSVHYLAELKNLCDEQGIELIVLTSPILESTYKEGVEHGYLSFLHDAAQVTDFYCFSGLNKYTCDPNFYFDASHFRPYVGYEMERVIFGSEEDRNKAQEAAGDDQAGVIRFGTKVTHENVDEVIICLEEEVKD